MQITVRVNDKGNIMQGLKNVGTAIPEIAQASILDALNQAMTMARTYPAPPHNSKYVRTNKYWDSFEVIPSGRMGGTLSSDAIDIRGRGYTVWVGGNAEGEGQSWNTVHWPIIKKQVDAIIPLITAAIEATFNRASPNFFAEIGRLGGLATYAKYGAAYMAEIGRRGGLATAALRRGG